MVASLGQTAAAMATSPNNRAPKRDNMLWPSFVVTNFLLMEISFLFGLECEFLVGDCRD